MPSDKVTFFNLPIENCVIRPALEDKAKELGLVINSFMDHKVMWSETHGGRCMCDWSSRVCPCDNISKDLVEYNGSCLCGVLVTKEKMERIEKNMSKKKVVKVKTKEELEIDKTKIKKAKEIAKKIGL